LYFLKPLQQKKPLLSKGFKEINLHTSRLKVLMMHCSFIAPKKWFNRSGRKLS